MEVKESTSSVQVEASTSRQGEPSLGGIHNRQDEGNEEVQQDEPHQPPSPPSQDNNTNNNEEGKE